MTITLVDSFVTRLLCIVQDVLVHVDGLTFPVDFVVVDMKNDSERSVILGHPFLAIEKVKIDVDTCELILKFNKEKVVFHAYQWKQYVEDLKTFYQLEEKGREVHKRMKKISFYRCKGIPCALCVLSIESQAIDLKEALDGRKPIIF